MRKISFSLVGCALVLACSRETPAPPAAPAPAPPPAPAPAAPPPERAGSAPAAPPAQPAHPPTCEVELSGQMKLPPKLKGKGHPVVHISDGDCLAPKANIIFSAAAPDGNIGLEFFSKWGADFTICGVLEEDGGKPARYYGKAEGKFHAEKTGEVEFRNLVIELKQGPPLTFPTVYNPPAKK